MIREEYTPSSRIRWWSIAEKPQRAAFVKKDRDQGGRKTLGPLERQYLVLSRNTGKSFHRFPLSIRSEWHQNPVGLTPFSPDRTCLSLSLSFPSNGVEKHTREKGWNLSAQNSHRNGISLCPLSLDPSELSSRRHRYPSSIFPVYKVWGGGRFPFEKFPRKGRREREKSAGILCKLNRVAFHVTRSTRVT